jgi:putative transposase
MPKSRGAHRRAQPTVVPYPAGFQALWRHAPVSLSPRARSRLAMLDWHHAHGSDVSRTARHFGFSRPTVYRWLARYDPRHPASLEDRPSRPSRCRRPTWTLEQARAVRHLRERYPRWGKEKLSVLLRREGLRLSASMVGRILGYLRRSGQLVEPRRARGRARRRTWRRPHAIRKPSAWTVERPGDLVELDTMDVRPLPGVVLKQFTARDVVSRWDTLELASQATASSALRILDALAARMPFPVRALQVDGGSEFMAGFETACAERGIALFELPPRSPKLNGAVERGNRTHAEESWEVTDVEVTVAALRPALCAWETTYDHIRPHQALGYLTPLEYLASVGIDV